MGGVGDITLENQVGELSRAFASAGFDFHFASVEKLDRPQWYSLWAERPEDRDMRSTLRRGGSDALNVYITGGLHATLHGEEVEPSGWANYPWENPEIDGVVVTNWSLPGREHNKVTNEGDTLVHETGHWLGLYHTFQGGCTGLGDRVDDTPAQQRSKPQGNCDEGDSCPSSPGNDPIHNFMDYSPDKCQTEFTEGQAARMRLFWTAFRQTAKSAANQAFTTGEGQHYFTSSSRGVGHHYWNPYRGKVRSRWAGPATVGSTVAYVRGRTQHVFGRTRDGRIIHWWWNPHNPGGRPRWTAWAAKGQALSDPAGFATSTEIHVFYRGRKGLEHRWYNEVISRPFHDNWGSSLYGQPVAYVRGQTQHVFGRTRDGRIIHWWWNPHNPGGRPRWTAWAAKGQALSDPAGFATSTEIHVFYRGRNSILEHQWFNEIINKPFHDNWGHL